MVIGPDPAPVHHAPPWLVVAFDEPHSVLSWAIQGGGWRSVTRVLWHEVRNADLPRSVDPREYLRQKLEAQGFEPEESLSFMTSAPLDEYCDIVQQTDTEWVRCIATVGLSNALRIGDPTSPITSAGTINLLIQTSRPLGFSASLEALSLAAEARTLVVFEAAVPSIVTGRIATGTGTDCIAIASPLRDECAIYAGKHTSMGHLVGESVRIAVAQGVERWKRRITSVDTPG